MHTIQQTVHDVTSRGVRMRVVQAGSLSSPPLVLIHGFLVSHLEFEDIIGPLAERYCVFAPDLPGFGESEKPTKEAYPYGFDTFSEAIADLIAAFDLGRPHVIGHSMGGAVALTLAAEHPELVGRLVVEDSLSYPFPLNFKARLPFLPLIGGFVFKQLYGRSLFRAYFRDDVFSSQVPFPVGRVDRLYDLFNTPEARASAYAVMHAVVDTRSIVARISKIMAPTLVVWGQGDKLFPLANAHRLAREIAGAELEIMNAGHSPHEEQPAAFLNRVTQFLDGKR